MCPARWAVLLSRFVFGFYIANSRAEENFLVCRMLALISRMMQISVVFAPLFPGRTCAIQNACSFVCTCCLSLQERKTTEGWSVRNSWRRS